MIKAPHSLSVNEVCQKLDSNPEQGLTNEEVKRRSQIYGRNILTTKKPRNLFLIFADQFLNPIVYLLAVAMLLSFAFNEWLEGFAVLSVILITSFIGFLMEWQAISSVKALRKMTETVATVIRNGKPDTIKASNLVPGDIISLNAGDIVPADCRIIESRSLAVKEAILTGESNQVEKNVDVFPEETPFVDQRNMVFNGTIVSRGKAKVIVVKTGDDTCIGQISSLTQKAEKERAPLEIKLGKLSHNLIWVTLSISVVIALTGYLQGKDLMLMVKTAIALAVASIPEGLPIVATIALARGMIRLSRRKVIIKKLEAVQTLGETGIICTDKTGTLTENKMMVEKVVTANGFRSKDDFLIDSNILQDQVLNKILQVSVLCNDCGLSDAAKRSDAVETALLEFAERTGFDTAGIRTAKKRVGEIPFDAENKRMATLHRSSHTYEVMAKGAVENILESCDRILTSEGVVSFDNKERWYSVSSETASEGLRVLAFAYKEAENKPNAEDYFKNLIFIGFLGFLDPPREDVKQTIDIYKKAGIKVVMITGDHPGTSKKIAEEIGLIEKGKDSGSVMVGSEIVDVNNPRIREKILNTTVFARMVPKQKLDLVQFYQKHKLVVGMLGDGVNDAPALKKADIGIVMGIRGSEAAKEVADVILLDDKFTSIELAVRQGRNIFGNIRKFVIFLLSCNLAEILVVGILSLSSLPINLLPLQILFLNLVTDIFPALALGMGKGDKSVMNKPPRNPEEPIMTKLLWRSTIMYSLSIAIGVVAIVVYSYSFKTYSWAEINNMAFYTLILAQLLNVFNLPNRKISFFINEVTANGWIWGAIIFSVSIVIGAFSIPLFREILDLVPLNFHQLTLIMLFSLATLLLSQGAKRFNLTL